MITRKIRTAVAYFVAFTLVGLTPVLASAASVYWTNPGTDNWTVASNWSSNPSLPGAADQANIGLGGTAQLSSATTITDFRAGHGGTNSGDGTVELNTGADLNLSNAYVKLTAGYTGTVNHNDGSMNVNGGVLEVGYASGTGDATYNLLGGSLNFTGGADLLMRYRGTFNWTAGALTDVDKVQVGSTGGDYKAVFNLGGNSLSTTGIVEVGRGGGSQADEFNFQSGEVISGDYFMVGGSTVPGGTVVDLNPTERLETASILYVGYVANALGVFNQNGGDLDVGSNLVIAGTADAEGIFNLNAGDLTFTNGDDIDMQRTSTFNWNAGTITGVDKVQVGSSGGDHKSVFNLNGMTLTTIGNVDVGRGGGSQADEFNFQGGEVIAGTYFLVGGSTAPGGTVVDLNPTERLETGSILYVGFTANTLGVFNQNGGDLDVGSELRLAGTGDANGIFNLNAGDLTFTGGGDIDMQRTSTFNWNAGTITDVDTVKVGSVGGDYKSIFNLGGQTLTPTGNVDVGRGGGSQADEFNFQGGTVNAGTYFLVGGSTAPGGTVVNLNSGDTLNTTSHLYVGYAANTLGVFSQNGGSLTIGDDLLLSNTANAQGLYRQNGGTTLFTGGSSDIVMDRTSDVEINGGTLSGVNNLNIGVGGSGTATYTQTGGSVSIDSFVRVGDNSGDEDFFNMTGGTFTLNNATADFVMENDSTANISGGTLNINRDMLISTISSQTSTVNQSGGLVDIAGNLDLATAAGSTGNYNLSGGTLNVEGVVELDGNGTEAFVLNGGMLQALTINNIEGNFSFTSGILTPGEVDVAETLNFNGNLTMNASSGLLFDLATPYVYGGPNDLLNVLGDLTLDGVVDMNPLSGFPGIGKFPIITFSGTLTDLGLDVSNPQTMSISIEGNTVFLSVIPEPNSALLLGTGLIGLAWRRRRQRA